MSLPKEFKSADQVSFEDWEKVHNKQFSDVLRLFDVAMVQAKENASEGWGFSAEAAVGGCQVKLSVVPPDHGDVAIQTVGGAGAHFLSGRAEREEEEQEHDRKGGSHYNRRR